MTLLRCRAQDLHILLALCFFPSHPDRLRHTVLLHVLAELHRPAIPIIYRMCLTSLLVLLDELSHGVEPQLVFLGFAIRVVACRHILEVDILEVVVKQLAHMRRDRLLVELRNLDFVGIDRAVGALDHLLEHVRGWQLMPRRVPITMILREEIVPPANRRTSLRDEKRLVGLFLKRLDVVCAE